MYPLETESAVIVFSIQLYLTSAAFRSTSRLTSQNMQLNIKMKPDHSRKMNAYTGSTPPKATM